MLAEAIAAQRARMRGYEVPSEALTLETIRAIDHLFCRELFTELPALQVSERKHQFILQRGVNEALARVLPPEPHHDDALPVGGRRLPRQIVTLPLIGYQGG